jgi:uncharacterized membrane protein YhaH (DUF805 family)
MYSFIIVLCFASLIGLQLGIYAILKEKGLTTNRSIFYTLIFFLMPLILVKAHISLYKERHILFQDIRSKIKLTDEQSFHVKSRLDSKTYFIVSLVSAISDIFTIKDNIKVLIEFAVQNDKKTLTKKPLSNKSLYEHAGLMGVTTKVFNLVSNEMKDHAKEAKLFKRYAAS